MSGSRFLGHRILTWAILTIFILLALLGAGTIFNSLALKDGTCVGVGGKLVETHHQIICVIDKENR